MSLNDVIEQYVLSIAGHKIFAHKAIVCARCEVMGAMFGGHFVEGSNSTSEVDDNYVII